MDMASIQSALVSLKTAGEIAKGMLELKQIAEVEGKVSELQRNIISAQISAIEANSAQSALTDKVRDLEQEIARLKDWNAEKIRYQLKPVRGSVVYALKGSQANSEPPHYLCTNCFNRGTKSFLGNNRAKDEYFVLSCAACGLTISLNSVHPFDPEFAEG